jgi:hypothetical protein
MPRAMRPSVVMNDLVISPARLRALRALHASRTGRRQSRRARERDSVLADLAAAVRSPDYHGRSIKACARYLKVSDRTVRRWLTGEDWPRMTEVRRVAQWLRTLPGC